jgi:hypothetical protein
MSEIDPTVTWVDDDRGDPLTKADLEAVGCSSFDEYFAGHFPDAEDDTCYDMDSDQIYVLRNVDGVWTGNNRSLEGVEVPVIRGFVSKHDLLEYCQEENITLGVEFDYDKDWQQECRDGWAAYGYDYVVVSLDDLISCVRNVTGDSCTE